MYIHVWESMNILKIRRDKFYPTLQELVCQNLPLWSGDKLRESSQSTSKPIQVNRLHKVPSLQPNSCNVWACSQPKPLVLKYFRSLTFLFDMVQQLNSPVKSRSLVFRSDTIELNFGCGSFLKSAKETFVTMFIELRALLMAVCDSLKRWVKGLALMLSHCV